MSRWLSFINSTLNYTFSYLENFNMHEHTVDLFVINKVNVYCK